MTFLLDNWKEIAIGLLVSGVLWLGNDLRGLVDYKTLQTKLESQKNADLAVCEKQKDITRDAIHSYYAAKSAHDKRIAGRVQSPSKCVPVAVTTGRTSGSASTNANGRTNAVSDTALYSIADDCEDYRVRLISLQNFVKQERAH